MSDIVKDAKADGYVETLLHRRRYIPDINSRNFNLRGFAERTAMNTPIQGSAADIIKLAMVEFDRQIKQTSYHAQLLLQVHDELIFKYLPMKLKILVYLLRKLWNTHYN